MIRCGPDCCLFFFPSRRRHTRSLCDWSSDVCSSDLAVALDGPQRLGGRGSDLVAVTRGVGVIGQALEMAAQGRVELEVGVSVDAHMALAVAGGIQEPGQLDTFPGDVQLPE